VTDKAKQQEQISKAERLQELLLESFESALLDGTITPTDRATLARLLSQNGWSLDPSKLPEGIKDKLTEHVDPTDLDDEVDVIPIERKLA
jgi:hypothetical protein